jgi:hypothetical protein
VQAPAAAAQTPPPAPAAASVGASLSSYDDFSLKMIATETLPRIWHDVQQTVNAPLPVASVIAGINKAEHIEGSPVNIGAAQVNPVIANMVATSLGASGGLYHRNLEKKLGIKITKADYVASLDKFDEVADMDFKKGIIDGTVASVTLGISGASAATPKAGSAAPSAGANPLSGSLGGLGQAMKDQLTQQLKNANPLKGLFGKK